MSNESEDVNNSNHFLILSVYGIFMYSVSCLCSAENENWFRILCCVCAFFFLFPTQCFQRIILYTMRSLCSTRKMNFLFIYLYFLIDNMIVFTHSTRIIGTDCTHIVVCIMYIYTIHTNNRRNMASIVNKNNLITNSLDRTKN